MRLLTALAGLLERLNQQQRQHQQQLHRNASPALLGRQAAQAQLAVARAACPVTATVLESYGGVLAKLLPPPQAAGQQRLQASLLHAAQKGLQYAWHAVRSLPHAAAVCTAAAWAQDWDDAEEMLQARSAVYSFHAHAVVVGEVQGGADPFGWTLATWCRGHLAPTRSSKTLFALLCNVCGAGPRDCATCTSEQAMRCSPAHPLPLAAPGLQGRCSSRLI